MKKKILFVDDEQALLKMIKLNLEATGKFEVRTESEGKRVLEAANLFKPDLILLDIVMPDVEGSEVARQLKSDAKLSDIPIVFLTATVTSEEIDSAGSTIGGQMFLAKPVTVKQLIDSMEKNLKP